MKIHVIYLYDDLYNNIFMNKLFYILLFYSFIRLISAQEAFIRPYKLGESFSIECRNDTGHWDGVICLESGAALKFSFGIDSFYYCSSNIADEAKFNRINALLRGEKHWDCRVGFAPDSQIYIPFTISLWGLAEVNHSHVNTHTNFVFHVDTGRIIAAGAYPVRDYFQLIQPNVIYNMHGAAKWFQKHSYTSVYGEDSSTGFTIPNEVSFVLAVALWTFICGVILLIGFYLIYSFHLKPSLIKKIKDKIQ